MFVIGLAPPQGLANFIFAPSLYGVFQCPVSRWSRHIESGKVEVVAMMVQCCVFFRFLCVRSIIPTKGRTGLKSLMTSSLMPLLDFGLWLALLLSSGLQMGLALERGSCGAVVIF